MEFEEFESLYMRACGIRDEFAQRMRPWFLGDAAQWPPVIGFGLPSDDREVRLVTVGLNPSNREIENGHIQAADDVNTQWAAQTGYFRSENQFDWFDRSEMVLTATGMGTYHAKGHVHLDLSSQPTSGGFDRIYDNEANNAERNAARQFIERCTTQIFLPTLNALVCGNCTRAILIYGFVPETDGHSQKGNRTMKETIGRVENLFQDIQVDSNPGRIVIARGKFNSQNGWISPYPALQKVRIIFLSRGPSYYSGNRGVRAQEDLGDAGKRLRRLRWLRCLPKFSLSVLVAAASVLLAVIWLLVHCAHPSD